MSEFTPITIESQEQLNDLFRERINKANEKHAQEIESVKSQYSDYEELKTFKTEYEGKLSELSNSLKEANEKANGTDQTIADLNEKIAKYESDSVKTRIAIEYGLPIELANRLTGDSEEELKADAEMFKSFTVSKSQPLANPEPIERDGVLEYFKQMNPNIKF